MQQLEEMARQQGKTVQQLQAELTQQSLNPVQKRRASRNAPNLAPPPPPAGPLDLSGLSPREQRLRERSARVSAGLNQGQDEAPAPRGVDGAKAVAYANRPASKDRRRNRRER